MLKLGEKGAIPQRDTETYAIAPHIPCGMVTPELLRRIADVAEKYNTQAVKITGAARIAIIDLDVHQGDGLGVETVVDLEGVLHRKHVDVDEHRLASGLHDHGGVVRDSVVLDGHQQHVAGQLGHSAYPTVERLGKPSRLFEREMRLISFRFTKSERRPC